MWTLPIVTLVAAMACAASAAAQTSGTTPGGVAWLAGGVSIEELGAMDKRKGEFSLWLTTAAKGSGAHLADVKVAITDARKQLVYEGVLPGPWLMINLPSGAYTVTATLRDQTQTRGTRIARGGRQQMVLYFDSPAEVSPDWQSPFKDGKDSADSRKQ